jgi:hypothetical protein
MPTIDQITTANRLDGIDMEEIKGAREAPRASKRLFRVADGNPCFQRTPREQNLLRLDINLEEQAIIGPAVSWPANGREIGLRDVVRRDEERVAVRHICLVYISLARERRVPGCHQAQIGTDGMEFRISRIQDLNTAITMADYIGIR